jgi:hypothetical protein
VAEILEVVLYAENIKAFFFKKKTDNHLVRGTKFKSFYKFIVTYLNCRVPSEELRLCVCIGKYKVRGINKS